MATWPVSLPQEFEQSGFRSEVPDQLVRSDGGGMPQRRRRARRDTARPIRGQMLMTTEQWLALRNFYDDDLGHGALAIDFPNPDDSSVTIQVVFESPPEMAPIGGDLHRISLSLIET